MDRIPERVEKRDAADSVMVQEWWIVIQVLKCLMRQKDRSSVLMQVYSAVTGEFCWVLVVAQNFAARLRRKEKDRARLIRALVKGR